jgi:hypothetical protein
MKWWQFAYPEPHNPDSSSLQSPRHHRLTTDHKYPRIGRFPLALGLPKRCPPSVSGKEQLSVSAAACITHMQPPTNNTQPSSTDTNRRVGHACSHGTCITASLGLGIAGMLPGVAGISLMVPMPGIVTLSPAGWLSRLWCRWAAMRGP